MKSRNLFDDIPTELPAELTQLLLEKPGVRIERIVSKGHASPENFWYDQSENEWVVLLSGSAGVQFKDENIHRELRPGNYLYIPAHARHRVEWTDAGTETVWLAIFFG